MNPKEVREYTHMLYNSVYLKITQMLASSLHCTVSLKHPPFFPQKQQVHRPIQKCVCVCVCVSHPAVHVPPELDPPALLYLECIHSSDYKEYSTQQGYFYTYFPFYKTVIAYLLSPHAP